MTRAAVHSASAGFTLVEAIAATLLMGIILAALATVTGQWLAGWDRGVARMQRAKLLAVELDRLTDDLAAAEFISAGPGNGNALPMFDGDKSSVIFVRTTLAPNAGGGLEVVRIAEISDEHGPALVRSTAPLPTGALQDLDALVFANPVVVNRAPYRVSFSYAGPDRVWRDAWQRQVQLPRAVRMQVRDNATSMLLAASTSTLIRTELPASCTWTGLVNNCPISSRRGASGTASGDAANGGVQGAPGNAAGNVGNGQ